MKVRQEVIVAKEILEAIQEEGTRRSIGWVEESHRDQKEELGVSGNFGIWCRTKASTKVCSLSGAKPDSNYF